MTVFEDLIVELKEENLLEETVISVEPGQAAGMFDLRPTEEHDFAELIDSGSPYAEPVEQDAQKDSDVKQAARRAASQIAAIVEQMSTYQTVEHILSAIERSPTNDRGGYDELKAKKALHAAQQSLGDESSSEFEEAASELRTQVAVWQNSLAARDERISVATMRVYCETCQPALSSQALFSLARFNRGISFTEASRRKYEFVVTRLFSRPAEGHRRIPICTREEMLSHLRSRFSDSFESYSRLYSGPIDIVPFVEAFDNFTAEAEEVIDLDHWLTSDFFSRLIQFKQITSEQFFVSDVTAAAITCNIVVLNKLAELIQAARIAGDVGGLPKKYSAVSESISSAIGRTFDLATLIGDDEAEKIDADEEAEYLSAPVASDRIDQELVERHKPAPAARPKKVNNGAKTPLISGLASVNKWLLVTTILVVIASVGLYVWADRYADTSDVTSKVQTVDLINSEFKDLLKEGRISGETFYSITQPTWDALSREDQEQAVQKIYNSFSQKGCRRVSLINAKGQPVGFASANKLQVFRP